MARDRREYSKIYRETNKELVSKWNKDWKKANPEKVKQYIFRSRIRYNYQMTEDEYNKRLANQNGVCAICKNVCNLGRVLSIDHNHNCCVKTPTCGKCTRGLICDNCNKGLGHFKDSRKLLRAADRYVAKHEIS